MLEAMRRVVVVLPILASLVVAGTAQAGHSSPASTIAKLRAENAGLRAANAVLRGEVGVLRRRLRAEDRGFGVGSYTTKNPAGLRLDCTTSQPNLGGLPILIQMRIWHGWLCTVSQQAPPGSSAWGAG
jgi:hypothetical protein